MRRLAAAAAVALAAMAAGTARADTFTVLRGGTVPTAPPLALPSAEVPNAPGSLLLPPGWTIAASTQRSVSPAELSALWQQGGAAYGIPWQVLAAINKIESNFGANMGPSSAGAVGWMQFMPDTWLRWGLDADGDGFADPWNARDAIFAAARYLAAAGGRNDVPRAIFAYNHADWYVRQVLDLAQLYGQTGTQVTFALDRVQVSLDEARDRLAAASDELAAARVVEGRLARRERSFLRRAEQADLLSDALDLQKQAALVGVERDAASARADEVQEEVRAARRALERARSLAGRAALSPGAGTLFGTAAFRDGYAFPVGGGPGTVSVAHTHHDYPAADIAAPQGAPLYALTNAVVTRAWSEPEGKCGIGFIIDGADGQSWTYCHLSYLEPAVHDGAVLTVGQPVGLVGSTGNSTGPHLHLQLNPTASYPQEQPWFQSFAGTAYRWQDAPTPDVATIAAPAPVFAPASGPVFAVVGSDDEPAPVFFTRTGG